MGITRSCTGMRLAKKRQNSADQEESNRRPAAQKMDGTANNPKIRLSARFHSVTINMFTGRKGGLSHM